MRYAVVLTRLLLVTSSRRKAHEFAAEGVHPAAGDKVMVLRRRGGFSEEERA